MLALAGSLAAIASPAGIAAAATGSTPTRPSAVKIRLPPPTGRQAVGTLTLDLLDRSRNDPFARKRTRRRLAVQVWYPATHTDARSVPYLPARIASLLETAFRARHGTFAAIRTHAAPRTAIIRGRHPLLLFSHGLGTMREFHTALAEDLASRGYIVTAIDHTYDAAAVQFANGDLMQGVAPETPTSRQRTLLLQTRVADARFVLDELTRRTRARTGLLAGKIDLRRVGALGHSLGGATAAAAMLDDRRIRAGVDLDGSVWGRVAAKGLNRPFMLFVGDELRRLTPDQAHFFAHLRSTRYALRLRGAGHFSFTDLPLFTAAVPRLGQAIETGTISPLRAQTAMRTYVASFFDRTLRGLRSPLLDGPSGAYPEVAFLARRSPRASDEATPVGWPARDTTSPHPA